MIDLSYLESLIQNRMSLINGILSKWSFVMHGSRSLSYDFFSLLCATHVRNGECVLRLFYVTLEGYSNVKSILLLLLTFFFFFCRHQILCFVFNHAAFASGSLYRYCSRLSAMLPAIVCDLVLSHSVSFSFFFSFLVFT